MKIKLFMLCLIFASFSFEMPAQTHLDALIKKSETLESVDMEVIKTKQANEKDAETKAVRIQIVNDKKLVNEFLDAFKLDASDAEQSTFKRRENREIYYYRCVFPKQTYTIIARDKGNAKVTVGKSVNFPEFRQIIPMDSLPWWDRQKYRMNPRFIYCEMDSIFSKYNIKADSLVRNSLKSIRTINWDSIASEATKKMDSVVKTSKVRWDEVLERYEFENP